MRFIRKAVNNLKVIAILSVLFTFLIITANKSYTLGILNFSREGETAVEKIDAFTAKVEEIWDAAIPGKKQLSSAAEKFHYYLTGEFYSVQVLQGEEGWLFYKATNDGDPIADYTGTNCFTEQEQTEIKDAVLQVQEDFQEKGIEFCLIIPPNKENVHSQFMPKSYEKAEITRTDRLIATLQEAGIHAVNPKEELTKYSANYETFYKYDTHWNELGAYIATRQILDLWGIRINEATKDNIITVDRINSDLAEMVGLQDIFNDDVGMTVAGLYDSIDWDAFYARQYAEASHYYNPEAQLDKTLVLVGDSFRAAMLPTVCAVFEDVYVMHRACYQPELINEYNPDYIIFEYVERYSGKIATSIG